MTGPFLYARPSDNWITSTAQISINTGGEDPAYPKVNLIDGLPDRKAKLNTASGSYVFDLGVARRVDFAPIIHHNFDAGLPVTLQGHDANSWGAPIIEVAYTIPARLPDLYTVNVWLDLTRSVPIAGNRTNRYWRLLIGGANSANVAIGEFGLYSTLRSFNIKGGSTRGTQRPAIMFETVRGMRHTYDLGSTLRTADVQVEGDAAFATEIDELFRSAAGITKGFPIVPYSAFGEKATNAETEAWFVTFADPRRAYTRVLAHFNTMALSFREVSRGLYP